ncbi:hypothetical protein MOV75_35685, partial [Bradyrhizobium sp. PRIMUS42]|nr:hypothetical protein [Bradyrhizobium sp. PRIMUS42]
CNGSIEEVLVGMVDNKMLDQQQLRELADQVAKAKKASGRALIKTGQSCNVAVPLTSVQYSSAGTVVQVIRRNRVETKRVEVGLMSGGNIEVRDGLNEGDVVVARAGALLREGDPVRPVMAAEAAK